MSLFQVMPPELATMRDVLRWAASRFNEAGVHFGHGTDNAIDEAMALVLQTLHLPFGIPDTLWDSRLTEDEKRHLVSRIRRRILERKPLPYITGEAWFCGLPFYVDERVLVPRSPIAELIEKHFEPWLDEDQVDAVLDLCTGSGCIAVACAYAFPHAEVHGADISEDALVVARRNVDRHGLADQVTLFQSDVFDGLPPEARYDLIVSNPPYVDVEDMNDLPVEFRHEPRLGLAAGDDGLDIVRRILAQAPGRLSEDGVLIIEVGNSAPALEEAFPELPFTWLEFERGGHGVCLLHAADLQVLE